MKFEYKCKFCQRPGFVITGDDPVELEAAKRWFPMLCCNRCGDFRIALRKLRDSLRSVARQLVVAPESKKSEAVSAAVPKLEVITKKICTLVCNFYRVQNTWSREFVDMILDNPSKCDVCVTVFVSGIAKIGRTVTPSLTTHHNDP